MVKLNQPLLQYLLLQKIASHNDEMLCQFLLLRPKATMTKWRNYALIAVTFLFYSFQKVNMKNEERQIRDLWTRASQS